MYDTGVKHPLPFTRAISGVTRTSRSTVPCCPGASVVAGARSPVLVRPSGPGVQRQIRARDADRLKRRSRPEDARQVQIQVGTEQVHVAGVGDGRSVNDGAFASTDFRVSRTDAR